MNAMRWLDQINLRVAQQKDIIRFRKRSAELVLCLLGLSLLILFFHYRNRPADTLLTMAFDASRPAITALNNAWNSQSNRNATAVHSGSLYQTEALANGLLADTICVSSAAELDRLSQGSVGLVAPDWRTHFPENSSPFSSSIVVILRPDNSHSIENWDDLLRMKQRIAIPDPHLSGAGQSAYLALVYSVEQRQGTAPLQLATALHFVQFLPYAAMQSTEVFLDDKQYAALLTWESEALRILKNPEYSDFQIIYPRDSLKIEPVVAVADSLVDQRGTREAAEDYLNFFFSPEGQDLIRQAGFRPSLSDTRENTEIQPNTLHTVEALFGSWSNAYEQHLGPNGSLTRLLEYRNARRGGSE
jgi:sulfate transport system substrate-binding protein